MTKTRIVGTFYAGQAVMVTNHYITRPNHPCFGTQQRTIAKVSSSHLTFAECGSVPWPKASELIWEPDGTILFYGGGLGQRPQELFLTIQRTK